MDFSIASQLDQEEWKSVAFFKIYFSTVGQFFILDCVSHFCLKIFEKK